MAGKERSLHDLVVTSGALEPIGVIQKIVDDQPRKVLELSPSTITDGEWDLLYSVAGEPVELYAAKTDPHHTRDVSHENREVVTSLHASYAAWLRAVATPEERLGSRLEL